MDRRPPMARYKTPRHGLPPVMSPRVRKAWLAVHITFSIAWLGALVTFLAFDVVTVASASQPTVRAGYIAMHLVAAWVILPLSLGAFLSGLVMALATPWGLFRHYWVVVSLVLTAFAIGALLVQLPTLESRADVAKDPAATDDDIEGLGHNLPRSIGGIVLLGLIIGISVYKPRGLTQHGWRKRLQAPDRGDKEP